MTTIVNFSKEIEKLADKAVEAKDAKLAYRLYMEAHNATNDKEEKLRLYSKALDVLVLSST